MNTHTQNSRTNIRFALLLAGIQVGGALLLTYARKQGLIDSETTARAAMILIGLCTAAWGNALPKLLDGPAPSSIEAASARQKVMRFTGWAMTGFGLIYAALWAFTPPQVANISSVAVGVTLMFVVAGYIMMIIRSR